MVASYTGSCKCGAVKIELEGEPSIQALCHCLNCRKSSGSTYSTNAIFPLNAFNVVSGEAKEYQSTGGSGNPAYISFCANCGSTMWSKTPLRPDIIIIKAGVLDGDAMEKFAPTVETFTSRKPNWVKNVDGTKLFENGFPAPPQQ